MTLGQELHLFMLFIALFIILVNFCASSKLKSHHYIKFLLTKL